MTTFTLDFAKAYRGITENDLRPILVRDPFGWDGKGEPEAAVVLTYTNGTVVNIPAREGTQGVPKFFVAHSPHSNQFDLVSLFEKQVLRFDIPVQGMPIWEDFVKPTYTGDVAVDQGLVDMNAYSTALDNWFNYVMTNEFRASACAYSDQGGKLGSFSSTDALLIEEFTTAPDFFAVNIMGSQFGDVFSGGDLFDTLRGAAGDDFVHGLAGNDTVIGGVGQDTLFGDSEADFIYGNDGNDLMYGGSENDRLDGGEGDDTVYGGFGSDSVSGANGNDVLHGDDGNDSLNGFYGTDDITGDGGNDSINGGGDSDILSGGNGDDTVWGGLAADDMSGDQGKDKLLGGDGDDLLSGGKGNDTLTGEAGKDAFLFRDVGPANADKITDFAHIEDKIALASGTFSEVHAALDPQEFIYGGVALDGDDRILYDPGSGRLLYDPDGNLNGAASAPAVLFAIISNHALLTIDDFLVV